MKAYICDICNEYVEDVYVNNSELFDIYPEEVEHILCLKKKKQIIDIRKECYEDIKKSVIDKYIEKHLRRENKT